MTNLITGAAGDDTLIGGAGDDLIQGLAGNDSLMGLGGRDQLLGGAGDDTVSGGLGDAQLDGGAGADLGVLDFAGASQSLAFAVSDNLGRTATVAGVQITGFEQVSITGGAA